MSEPKRFAPRCAHPGCGAYAGFGYGCTREIGSGTWYCGRHRPSDEMPAVKVEEAPPLKRIPGGLF